MLEALADLELPVSLDKCVLFRAASNIHCIGREKCRCFLWKSSLPQACINSLVHNAVTIARTIGDGTNICQCYATQFPSSKEEGRFAQLFITQTMLTRFNFAFHRLSRAKASSSLHTRDKSSDFIFEVSHKYRTPQAIPCVKGATAIEHRTAALADGTHSLRVQGSEKHSVTHTTSLHTHTREKQFCVFGEHLPLAPHVSTTINIARL